MNKKRLFISIFILSCFILVLPLATAPQNSGGPDSYGEWYGGDALREWGNFFSFNDNFQEVDVLENRWYPVEPWEVQVCSQGLTSDLVSTDGSYSNFDGNALVFDLTLTLQGLYEDVGYNNIRLYEFAWFVQPYENTVQYNVMILNNSVWQNYISKSASAVSGDSYYDAFYSSDDIQEIKLVISGQDYKVSVVEK